MTAAPAIPSAVVTGIAAHPAIPLWLEYLALSSIRHTVKISLVVILVQLLLMMIDDDG